MRHGIAKPSYSHRHKKKAKRMGTTRRHSNAKPVLSMTNSPAMKFIDATVSTADEEPAIVRDICKQLLPQWSAVPDDEVVVRTLSGGITNMLYIVKSKARGDGKTNCEKVLARVYGQNTELLIDRQAELRNMKMLHQNRLAPPVYGTFQNGFVYGFVEGSTAEAADVVKPTIQQQIGVALAEVHRLSAPQTEPSTQLDVMAEWLTLIGRTVDTENGLVGTLTFKDICQEFEWLRKRLPALGSPLVICHNDLLTGNIILQEGKVAFVDYEYMGLGYRGFDLGNHCSEYMGFEMERERYPELDDKRPLLESYLHAIKGGPPSEDEIRALNDEIDTFAPVSRFWWGLWAIVQSMHSTIEFDYSNYSEMCFTFYFDKKHLLQ